MNNQGILISERELRALLTAFESNNGVNVKPIVSDFAATGANEEQIRMKLALLYAGAGVNVLTNEEQLPVVYTNDNTSSRGDYKDVTIFIFKGYTYLTDTVAYDRLSYTLREDENGNKVDYYGNKISISVNPEKMSLEQWLSCTKVTTKTFQYLPSEVKTNDLRVLVEKLEANANTAECSEVSSYSI